MGAAQRPRELAVVANRGGLAHRTGVRLLVLVAPLVLGCVANDESSPSPSVALVEDSAGVQPKPRREPDEGDTRDAVATDSSRRRLSVGATSSIPDVTTADTGEFIDAHHAIRRAPAGTSEAAQRALERLPIAVEDRPPIGGVANSGLHVDRIALGRASAAGRCIAGQHKFSVKGRARPTVCFRVVHDRIAEPIDVEWEQTSGTLRRTRINVPPVHGYRTRAHLVLRPEYVGSWTARVVADESIELAAVDFEVVN